MNTQKQEYRMGVGASSILMIFVLLSLTTLGVLSFASARADWTLTMRRQEQVQVYYGACSEAQRVIAGVDEALLSAPDTAEAYAAYIKGLADDRLTVSEDLLISFVVPINEAQQLEVALQATGPGAAERYVIQYHKIVSIVKWDATKIGL